MSWWDDSGWNLGRFKYKYPAEGALMAQGSKCRRVIPQPATWRDLPRIIPFAQTFTTANAQTTRVTNAAKVPFHCAGLAIPPVPGGLAWRVKWPDGTYLSRDPFLTLVSGGPLNGPLGDAGNMVAFPSPVVIQPGSRIAVETSGATGDFSLQFWGFLRYPDSSPNIQRACELENAKGVQTQCVIGYPAGDGCLIGYPSRRAAASGAESAAAAAFTAAAWSDRFQCNGNLLAPEFRLGNQCDTFTPEGYADEQFSFLGPQITLEPGDVQSGINVVIPGLADTTMVFRRWRALVSWVASGGGPADGVPAVGLRTPDAFSITGGDMIPLLPWAWIPFPVFGEMRAGGRLVLDVSTFLATSATASMTFQIEFDCVKRTRAS